MPIQLPFALRAGRLIGIEEAESGLASRCTCPGCGAPLIARKGKSRTHHFAHHRAPACPHALESTFHRLAKEILEEERCIRLPAVRLAQHDHQLFGPQFLRFDRVYVEKRLPGLQPDLIVEAKGKPVLLEIAVTHPAGRAKIRQLHRQQLAAVEIDLAPWLREKKEKGEPVTRQALRDLLLFAVFNKRWLFNPRRQYLEAALRKVSDKKPVKRKSHYQRRFYQVRPCPRRVRSYQPAFGPVVHFADVFQDCLHCPFCLEIDYDRAFRGFREVPTEPKTVVCWGKWEGKEKELVDLLL